jgi:hypothetical protein
VINPVPPAAQSLVASTVVDPLSVEDEVSVVLESTPWHDASENSGPSIKTLPAAFISALRFNFFSTVSRPGILITILFKQYLWDSCVMSDIYFTRGLFLE